MSERKIKNARGGLRTAVMASVFAAIIFVTIAIIPPIPIPGGAGYLHFGDGLILLAAYFLPMPYAIAASAIGAGLADLYFGAPIWIPATVVIKAIMAVCITSRKKALSVRNILGIAVAIIVNAVGYYLFQSVFISQSFIVSLVDLPFNLLQTAVGGVLFLILGTVLERVPSIRSIMPTAKDRNESK